MSMQIDYHHRKNVMLLLLTDLLLCNRSIDLTVLVSGFNFCALSFASPELEV